MLFWSHESSHLHYPNEFCILGSAFNTTFLDQSSLCPFCWSGAPSFEANASNTAAMSEVSTIHTTAFHTKQSELSLVREWLEI